MSWLGKILGGGLGFMIGGPFGALLGAVIGHHTMDRGQFQAVEQKQGVYFIGVFAMLGKLAKADGTVSTQEIEAIDRVMRDNLRLTPGARDFAIGIFNRARDSDETFAGYARQFFDEFQDSTEILVSVVELLLHVAYADGELHAAEEAMIVDAARLFGVEDRLAEMKSLYTGSVTDLKACYAMLGAEEGMSLAEVKKKYRRLAMEHHPDRLQSKGMPPEFVAEAEEKFKEIQHAYDTIEKRLKT